MALLGRARRGALVALCAVRGRATGPPGRASRLWRWRRSGAVVGLLAHAAQLSRDFRERASPARRGGARDVRRKRFLHEQLDGSSRFALAAALAIFGAVAGGYVDKSLHKILLPALKIQRCMAGQRKVPDDLHARRLQILSFCVCTYIVMQIYVYVYTYMSTSEIESETPEEVDKKSKKNSFI